MNYYRKDIDGLRAIAVTSVVLFHAGLTTLSSGYVGVDIFFVISGFLIGGIIFREVGSEVFSYSSFYARRLKRIIPALLFVSMVSMCAAVILLTTKNLSQFLLSEICAIFGLSNIFFYYKLDYFLGSAKLLPFLMTWSLGVEEQFYVLFPPLVFSLRNQRWQIALAAIGLISAVSLALCIGLTYTYPSAAFYLIPARAWELGIGACLAVWRLHDRDRSDGPLREAIAALGLALLVYSIVGLGEHAAFPGYIALVPTLGAALLIHSEGSWINRAILGNRVFVGIGLISYSWYLWHWPVMSFIRVASYVGPTPAAMATAVAISLVLAYLSWRFIERPFRRIELSDRSILQRYGATAIAACVLIGVVLLVETRLLHKPGTAKFDIASQSAHPCLLKEGGNQPVHSGNCNFVGNGTTIAVIGDSHSDALAPAIRAYAKAHHQGFAQYSKSSCPVLDRLTRFDPALPMHAQQCASFSAHALSEIIHDPRIKTVVVANFWSAPMASLTGERYLSLANNGPQRADEILAQGITQTAELLGRAGKRLVIMGDTPDFDFDVFQTVAARSMPARRFLGRMVDPEDFVFDDQVSRSHVNDKVEQINKIIRDASDHGKGSTYFDLFGQFCNMSSCTYSSGNIPYFFDHHHLTQEGAIRAINGQIFM